MVHIHSKRRVLFMLYISLPLMGPLPSYATFLWGHSHHRPPSLVLWDHSHHRPPSFSNHFLSAGWVALLHRGTTAHSEHTCNTTSPPSSLREAIYLIRPFFHFRMGGLIIGGLPVLYIQRYGCSIQNNKCTCTCICSIYKYGCFIITRGVL